MDKKETEKLKQEVQRYIDANYDPNDIYNEKTLFGGQSYSIQEDVFDFSNRCIGFVTSREAHEVIAKEINIAQKTEKSFSGRLWEIINGKKNFNPVKMYKEYEISSTVWSDVFKPDYKPSKDTVIKICFGLNLNLTEAEELVKSAGFYLSKANTRDLIFRKFFESRDNDIWRINCVLEEFKQTLLFKKTQN